MAPASLDPLYQTLGHRFENAELLIEALTHPSMDARRRQGGDYERLEFLGDRVLGLIIASKLYRLDTTASAGQLAVRFNALVRKETVAEVAREIGLSANLILSQSEEQVGGRDKTAILGNAMEAVLGALYLDGGFHCAKAFVEARWAERIAGAATTAKDAKTQLQERVQRKQAEPPRYRIVAEAGPPHERQFTVEVEVDDGLTARGEGRSKRAAEQAAAAELLARLASDA